jgi:CRP-like cAMP-binding protein
MPKTLQFRAGSVIYFQGDAADKIFVLQAGQINLVYQDIETGENEHDFVQSGEFFGVKSALGRYPREENAIALQDTTVMAFTITEFESLAMTNTRIVMQMLKIFSNQLRQIHRQVSNLTKQQESQDPELGLFNVGKYFLINKKYPQAKYVFARYLAYYPSGKNAAQAKKNLQLAEIHVGTTSSRAAENFQEAPEQKPDLPMPDPVPGQSSEADVYNSAMNCILQGKYQQAYMGFGKIIQADTDSDYTLKSSYELGRCLYLLAKYKECIQYYTMMITKYPKHPNLAAVLTFMGQSYEKTGNKDQAAVFLKKARSLSGESEDDAQVKDPQALKALDV